MSLYRLHRADALFGFGPGIPSRPAQVVVHLQAQPKFRRDAEIFAEAKRRMVGDGAAPARDIVDPRHRHVDIPGQPVLADTVGFQEFLKNFTGRDGIEALGHG